MVRQGCKLLLESQNIIIVAEAESGEEAFRYLNEVTPDIAVVDLSMENMGGLEVISRMNMRYPEIKIIVFSMHDDPFFTQRAFKNGASGYVSKSNPPETLIEAIGHIMTGGQFISPDIAKKLAFDQYYEATAHPLKQLTSREIDIFHRLAQGKSSAQIAEDLSLSRKSISNYIGGLKKKLNADSTANLIKIAITTFKES
ncbi:hypothetical protein ATN88_09295 [Enterovibrio coralii]|uniref:LuxR family transcriptional regulator n=2 Tax=Enterovibrio coralii TaxID=294935 RepID=A0A135IAJ2_9GAMM|nr:hypothetical protein ATN88_09295 [Enterovibrio coralii]